MAKKEHLSKCEKSAGVLFSAFVLHLKNLGHITARHCWVHFSINYVLMYFQIIDIQNDSGEVPYK